MSGSLVPIDQNEVMKAEIARMHVQLERLPLVWAWMYLPEHFRKDSPAFHQKMLTEAERFDFFACASPRESAKTAVLNFLVNIHDIVYKRARFILILQNTEEKAQDNLDSIKDEIKNNPMLVEYGITITRDKKDDTIFSHPCGHRVRVLCKGMLQMGSIRGMKFGAWRPDRIVVDDLEDDKMVKNPVLRQELQETFDQVIIPAGQQGACKFRVVGTIFHDDSLMAKLVSPNHYKNWRKLLFKALNVDDKGKEFSLWEETWSVKRLHEIERLKPDVFAMEYQNNPVSGLLSKFDKRDWRNWYIEDGQAILLSEDNRVVSRYKLLDCKAAIACDLAWEDKKSSDSSVIMPGLLTPKSEMLIDEYICEKGMRPDQMEEYLFSMEEKYRKMTGKSVPIGFEKGKIEKVMKFFMRQAMARRNHWLMFKDIVWGADKVERIVTRLQPRYKQHSIFHRSGMGELEYQLLRIPSGTHDDLADAAQGLVQLLKTAPKVKVDKVVIEDEGFEWLRNQVVKRNKPKRPKKYVFGNKNKRQKLNIPAKETFR